MTINLGKNAAVRFLGEPAESVRIYPGLTHTLTRAEQAFLETRPVQRMSRLRQTGLAFLTIPTNENTRLPHCIGTAYWTVRFLESMRTNGFAARTADGFDRLPGNVERLEFLDGLLGEDLSLDLVARIYALVHDSDLLPFGHTLSYQLGYYAPPGDIERFQRYLGVIGAELYGSRILQSIEDDQRREEVRQCLHRHLAAVEAVAVSVNLLHGRAAGHSGQTDEQVAALLPVYTFVETLVTATVSADLLDFALRDNLGAGTPWSFDDSLLGFACVLATTPTDEESLLLVGHTDTQRQPLDRLFRFGVNGIRDGRRCHQAVSGVTDLLRVRYELLERIVYAPGKCVADAMLDRAIRNVNTYHAGEPFDEAELLTMGDDQFLDMLETGEQQVNLPAGCLPVIPDIRARRLWAEAYHCDDRSRLSERGLALIDGKPSPSQREVIEELLLHSLPGVAPTEIVVSCLPPSMQMKDPQILVNWVDGVVSLGDLANETGYGDDSLALTRRYSELWSVSVYSRERSATHVANVDKAAVAVFEN